MIDFYVPGYYARHRLEVPMHYVKRCIDPHPDTLSVWQAATQTKAHDEAHIDFEGEGREPLFVLNTPNGVYVETLGVWDNGGGICIRVFCLEKIETEQPVGLS